MTEPGDHPEHEPSGRTRFRMIRRLGAGLVGAALVVAAGSACGSSSTSNESSAPSEATTTTAGSTYELVPDAVVTAGLAEVRRQAAQIKATLPTNQAEAEALTTAMYDKWFSFEGTVRKNDKNLYLQMEDGLAAIKSGAQLNNMAKVDKGIKDLEEGATAYLAAHP